MSVRNILIYPHEYLRKKTVEVKELNDEILKVAKDLVDTMKAYDGVGLSANQIGEPWSMFALDLEYLEVGKGAEVYVNPRIVYKEGKYVDEEGCLSFPDLFIEIERSEFVIMEAFVIRENRLEKVEVSANELFARVIQHENDHLNGILFIDYLPLNKRARILKEWMEKISSNSPS